jgi:dUTP pyrophosphatase
MSSILESLTPLEVSLMALSFVIFLFLYMFPTYIHHTTSKTDSELNLTYPIVEFVLTKKDAIPPAYSTEGASGMDIAACESGEVQPNSQKIINTGIVFSIPKGWEGKIESRSGLTVKFDTSIPTGTIDSDYREESCIVLRNNGNYTFNYNRGDKLAQMKIYLAPQATLVQKVRVDELTSTKRGSNGFGSTGISTQESNIN